MSDDVVGDLRDGCFKWCESLRCVLSGLLFPVFGGSGVEEPRIFDGVCVLCKKLCHVKFGHSSSVKQISSQNAD